MKNRILNYALCIIALASTLLALPHLPERVPMHFDASGAVDRYGSKYELFLLPIVMIISNIASEIGYARAKKKGLDPESRAVMSARINSKVTTVSVTILSAVFVVLNFGILYIAYSSTDNLGNLPFDFSGILTVTLGISIAVLGNYMPKTKRNGVIGMRSAWSMYNDVTWQKSNRFAAYVMMAAGIISALCGLIFGGMLSLFIIVGALAIAAVVVLIYSYRVYCKEKNNVENN